MSLNNKDLANVYLNEAKLRIKVAKNEVNENAFAFSFRLCQEAVELSLKAALRLLGIDFPKWHDVSEVFVSEKDRFPDFFQNNIQKIASISKSLSSKRELAMHGDEERKKSSSAIFNKKIADEALKDAKFCMGIVENLFELLIKENENAK